MKNILKGQSVYLLKPILFLAITFILIIILVYISFNQISSVISKANTAKSTESALSKKVSTLEEVDEIIANNTTFLDVVLPSKAVTLYGLSQIKRQVSNNGLVVSNVKTSGAVPLSGGIFRTSITFEVEGNEASIYTFFESFSKVLPLMSIDKIKITRSATSARAASTLNVYSAELPKTIPSLSSSISSLSTAEIALLRELATFEMPQFVEPKTPEVSTKADPFN